MVVAVIGLLCALALPSMRKARERSQTTTCKNNARLIFDAINVYVMDNPITMSPADWPNLCAARDRLAPGGTHLYLRSWDVFECPVADTQDQHDYAYEFVNNQMIDIRCNNDHVAVRNMHNAE